MLPFHTIFLLILYFTFTNSLVTNNSNPDHHLIPSNKAIDQFDKHNHTNNLPLEKSHRRLLHERLKIIITISSISIGIMVIIVSTFIAVKYLRSRTIDVPETTDQTIPLNRSNQIACNVPRKTKPTPASYFT